MIIHVSFFSSFLLLFLVSPHHLSLFVHCCVFFHALCMSPTLPFHFLSLLPMYKLAFALCVLHLLPLFFLLALFADLFSPPANASFPFLCPVLSLSQITVSVAQGRVRSPSPQPRYKSYAYTQAAYVKSPEQKRRRFADQVRAIIPCQTPICLCMFRLQTCPFCLPYSSVSLTKNVHHVIKF